MVLNTVRASLFKGPSVYWWELEAILPVSAASDPSPVGAGLGSRSPSGAAVAARRCMVRIKKPGLACVCDAGIARCNFSAKPFGKELQPLLKKVYALIETLFIARFEGCFYHADSAFQICISISKKFEGCFLVACGHGVTSGLRE